MGLGVALGAVALGRIAMVDSKERVRVAAVDLGYTPGDSASASAAQGWPNLFGPTHDSVSLEANIRTQWPAGGPPLKWRREVGTGYSAPICWDDRLIVFQRIADEELVECCDAESGAPQWRNAWPAGFRWSPAYASSSPEYSNGPYSTPVIDEARVYAWGGGGRLQCLDAATGERLWHRSLNDEYQATLEGFFPVAASPLLEGDRLILNVGGKESAAGIVALDARTGQTLWTATADGAGHATPVAATIHSRRYVFVFTADGLVSLDPADGRVCWSIPFRARNRDVVNATSPIVYGDIVFVSGYQLGNLCVRVLPDGSYQELWRDKRRNLDSQYNNLLCLDGYVYGFSALDRSFRCLELTTGSVRWKWDSDIGRGASLAAGGRILVLGEHGHLGAIEVDPHEARPVCITGQSLLEGQPCYTAPALHRGLLYVRADKTLLCLDLR
jgi:outer membrane protein assembly factor BamB